MIYLASDHGGFETKEALKKYLEELKVDYSDKGPFSLNPDDDFPDFAYPAVAAMEPETDRAILLCRSGEGMAIIANKLPGIRAAVVWNEKVAAASRRDDDVNVIAIPSDYVDLEQAKAAVKAFIDTPFAAENRYIRRLNKIRTVEERLHSQVKDAYNE